MESKKKIEIVDIDLGIDISEEIKRKVDSFNSNITLYTKELAERTADKQTTKKQLKQIEKEQRIDKAINKLMEYYETEDKWIKGWQLVQHVGLEPSPQNTSKLSMQIRKKLKEEGKWTLLSARKRGKTVYRLNRFG